MERTHIIFVNGMTCENCKKRIANELDNTRVKYDISLENQSITIKGDNDALYIAKQAINRAGYTIQ